jgi:DNA-binding transcriptional MerR regulator
MSLGELTEEAGVSVRTVRYYIAEGLLPPPEGAGPASAYTPGHLNRLRLIQRLKESYLPLKEIRRRLSGLDDGEIETILAGEEDALAANEAAEASPDASLAGAREYLALLESREAYRTEPLPFVSPSAGATPATPAPASPATASPAAALAEPRFAHKPARSGPPRPAAVHPARPPQTTESAASQTLWHRIPLGEEAELVISDRVYGRHRDRVDWLVRWARKVFG